MLDLLVFVNSLLEKISTCHNDLKRPSTTKIDKHTPSGYSLFTLIVHLMLQKTSLIVIGTKTVWKVFLMI